MSQQWCAASHMCVCTPLTCGAFWNYSVYVGWRQTALHGIQGCEAVAQALLSSAFKLSKLSPPTQQAAALTNQPQLVTHNHTLCNKARAGHCFTAVLDRTPGPRRLGEQPCLVGWHTDHVALLLLFCVATKHDRIMGVAGWKGGCTGS